MNFDRQHRKYWMIFAAKKLIFGDYLILHFPLNTIYDSKYFAIKFLR